MLFARYGGDAILFAQALLLEMPFDKTMVKLRKSDISPLISIAPSLSEDTVLYRTMDFFSAAEMCSSATLMFSRADMFSDRNEGIDRLLTQLNLTQPRSGCGMGWSDEKTARRMHDRIKRSHYISCWSQNAESVAMWALYSSDHCSVRVSTTVSKLLPAVDNLVSKYSLLRLNSKDFNKRVAVAVTASIEPVMYEDLAGILGKVSRRAKARRRLDERYERRGVERPKFTEINPRYWEREAQRRFLDVSATCRLKDASLSHEAEVRLSVRIGEEVFSERMLEDQAIFDPTHKYHSLLKEDLRAWGWISTVDIPEREIIGCPTNLIESVAIDPRCPPHKARFIAAWFRDQGIRVDKSTCFGYLPNTFSVYPDK